MIEVQQGVYYIDRAGTWHNLETDDLSKLSAVDVIYAQRLIHAAGEPIGAGKWRLHGADLTGLVYADGIERAVQLPASPNALTKEQFSWLTAYLTVGRKRLQEVA